MMSIITDVLVNGQPLYRGYVPNADGTHTVVWQTRKVTGDYPRSWRHAGYVELARLNLAVIPKDQWVESIRLAQQEVLKLPGVVQNVPRGTCHLNNRS